MSSFTYRFFTWPNFYRDMVTQFPSGSHFVEVGLLEGRSFEYLINQIIRSGKNIRVTGVDHFREQSEGMAAKFYENMKPYNGLFDFIEGESVEVAKTFENKSLDFVFIDAAHDYESVRADIEAWMPKTRGIIAGHDYIPTYPGVMQAVDEKFGADVDKKYTYEGCWMYDLRLFYIL